MKKYIGLFSCFVYLMLLSVNVFAQNPSTILSPQGKQPLNGVSSERLDRIDQMLEQTLSNKQKVLQMFLRVQKWQKIRFLELPLNPKQLLPRL
jgi:hypothetical protein